MTTEARIYNGKRQSRQYMMLGKLNRYMQKNKTGPLSYNIHKKSKWIKNLNIRLKTIKLLEEKTGSILFNIYFSNIWFWPWLFRQGDQNKTQQMVLHQTKKFCTAKESLTNTKQPTECEKIFTNHIFNKGLIPKYIKHVYNLI